jgi:hypothetical protein
MAKNAEVQSLAAQEKIQRRVRACQKEKEAVFTRFRECPDRGMGVDSAGLNL